MRIGKWTWILVALLASVLMALTSPAAACSTPKECGDVTNNVTNNISNNQQQQNTQIQKNIQTQGQTQVQTQGQSMGDQENSQSVSIKNEARRGLADMVTAGGPAEARFREDTRYEADWRVLSVGAILNRQSVWEYEEGKKLSANLHPRKMHKNLLRVMEQKTQVVAYVKEPPVATGAEDMVIFLGYIPMSPDLRRGGLIAWLSSDGAIDQTTANLIGNQVVAACEAGATHLVPVKDGFIRGGHSEVDFIGLAGGGSSVFEDGRKAGGVSGSVGPSRTTMDAWDVDRPYAVAEAWFRLSDRKKLHR